MTMDPFAPLGRFVDDQQRLCNYSPGDTPSADCGTEATWHVMWNVAAEVSFACDPHMDRARSRFVFVDSHPVGPDCGMPGALWDLEHQRCVYPDEAAERGQYRAESDALCT
ncbi:hypothetical protein [Streptomyces sp. NPDC046862]|uniref:hypothetical protein n=1 Tax=Streptomyces sp. NPDC046862 TaxID=3154603 RepID=UPI00345420EA